MTTRSWRSLYGLLFFATVTAGGSLVAAEEKPAETDNWHLHQPHQAWLQPFDPTLLAPRLLTQGEYQSLAHGDATGKVFVNVREAWLLARSLAFGLQMEVPLNWAEKAGEEFSGLGDLESRVGLVGRLAPGLRWGLGLNTRFDTASEPALGDGVFEMRTIATLRWDATPFLNLGLQPEYTFTPTTDGVGEIESLQLKLPVTIKLTHGWSFYASYQPKWNLAAGDTRQDRLELSTTFLLGPQRNYAVTMGVETPLSADSLDWKGYIGFQWFFH